MLIVCITLAAAGLFGCGDTGDSYPPTNTPGDQTAPGPQAPQNPAAPPTSEPAPAEPEPQAQ
jgi:hypothetical protein